MKKSLDADVMLERADWRQYRAPLQHIRHQVFVLEQGVPEHEEWDGQDRSAIHLLVSHRRTREPVACVRVLQQGKITRMAVIKAFRNQGIGRYLLAAAEACIRELRQPQAKLDAQIGAKAFYLNAGYHCVGEPFVDAGIDHIRMVKSLHR